MGAADRRVPEPMLPLRSFGTPGFAAGNAAIFFLWGSALGALFFMAQFMETGLGLGPLAAGLALMPWGATTFVVPQIAGALINRLGERAFIVAGMVSHGAAMAWIGLIAKPGPGYGQMVVPLVLSGIGVAMAKPATQSAVLGSAAPQYVGRASGTYSTMRQLGGVFGVAVAVAVFAGGAGSYVSARAFTAGFASAMGACAVLSLAGATTAPATRGRVKASPRYLQGGLIIYR